MLTATVALQGATAQGLPPESFAGTFWGAMIGGALGGDRHCGWSGDGAAIGAGIGFVLGTISGEARRQQYYNNSPYIYSASPYGYRYGAEYAPTAPVAPVSTARPNYAVGGTLVGAASGALIGEGTSGKPGQGAAIGAAAGLVVGSLAEHNARRREKAVAAARQTPVYTPPQSAWAPAPAIYNRIPDAPRVPDAPTF